MRDYNYFSLVKRRKKNQELSINTSGKNYLALLLLVAVIASIAWPFFNQIRLMTINSRINSTHQSLVNDPQYSLFQDLQQKQMDISNGHYQLSSLQEVAQAIREKEVITERLLDEITELLPADTHLTSLELTNQTVSMTGVARSRAAVAELLLNLRHSDRFSQPYIPSLNESNQLYQFNLSFDIRGGGS
ncbi:MAG: hypothetical protein D5S00_09025 [Tindallia sp. MSAO_Bac2]|nr:MAG: hypothetical protein D5S00_09025 [Tindallia sp. MSAO_Bac2]